MGERHRPGPRDARAEPRAALRGGRRAGQQRTGRRRPGSRALSITRAQRLSLAAARDRISRGRRHDAPAHFEK
ncbi:hypothetical protein EMIT0158MI4_10099 [Burkholderia ambifaria]